MLALWRYQLIQTECQSSCQVLSVWILFDCVTGMEEIRESTVLLWSCGECTWILEPMHHHCTKQCDILMHALGLTDQ